MMTPIDAQTRRGLSVVAITQDECCVWNDGLAPNATPLRIHPKVFAGKKTFLNVRKGKNHRGHDVDKFGKEYLESISLALDDAKRFLVITHGSGKSNAYAAFEEHLNSHHVSLVHGLVGHIEADLSNLTDPQILALARDWYESHYSFLDLT